MFIVEYQVLGWISPIYYKFNSLSTPGIVATRALSERLGLILTLRA
jgi:hypothetical protein